MNLLQQELNNLIKEDTQIFNFIEENALDGLWYWDLENPERGWANDKFWKALGYTCKETKNESLNWQNVAHQADVKTAKTSSKKHIENPEKYPFRETIRYSHKNGHTVWLLCRGTVLLNKDNKPYRMLGTHTCLTKQKEAEILLNKNIRHYENVIEGGRIGTWEYNLETNKVKYNKRWAEIFGYTLKELQPISPETWLLYVHPDDIEKVNQALENYYIETEYYVFEFRMKHKLGHWVWILSHGKVMKYNTSKQPILIAGSHYDITKRKENELNLAHFKNLLEQSNNAAQVGHWEVNFKDSTVFWSNVTKSIHDAPADYMPTLETALNFYPEGTNRERITIAVNNAIEKGEDYDIELQIKTLKGKLKWVRAVGTCVINEHNEQRLYGLFQDIDKLKTTQLETALSEEQFRQTFNYASIGMALINTKGQLIQANQSFCKMFGYAQKEMHQIDLPSLSHPEDANLTAKYFPELLNGKRNSIKLEKRYIHKNGKIIWASSSMSAVRNDKQDVVSFVIQIQDITENKANELLLLKNSELLESINNTAQIGIWELDIATNTVNWSKTVKSIMGVSSSFTPSLEEAIGFFKEGESHDKLNAAINIAKEKGTSFDLELEIVTKDTNISKWTRTIGVTEFEDGKFTRLYGFFQDIDEKTKINKELALKEEELRQTFTNASMAMAFIELDGSIKKANLSCFKLLGYSVDELKGLTFKDFTHPDDIIITYNVLSELLEQKRDSYQIDKRYIHKNGHTVWVSINMSSIKNDAGELIHFLAQIKNITEHKENELLLTNYQTLLEQSNALAKIGSWEVDINNNNQVSWGNPLKEILEVPENFEPNLEASIKFIPKDKSNEEIQNALNDALTKGLNFDHTLQISTYQNNNKWIRVIGISEFENNKCKRLHGLIQDITHIKNAEQEIALKEEQLRTTFDHSETGMAFITIEGKILKANTRFHTVLGYSHKEILQLKIADFTHTEDISKSHNFLEEIRDGKRESYNLVKRYISKKGDIIWANASVSAVKNDKGDFTHIVAQIVDISESHTNHLLLRQYKDLLERSNQVAKIGSWEVDPKNNNTTWSDNIIELLEEDKFKPQTSGQSIESYVLESDQEKISKVFNTAITEGKNFDIEAQIKTAKNNNKWMRIIGISEFENGKCLRMHGLIQDIDVEKRSREKVALREEQFRQTFWHANVGMALINLKGSITRANPSICDIFGRTEKEMKKIPLPVLSHPDDIEPARTLLTELREGKRDNFQLEKRFIHKKGYDIWVSITASTVKNDLGKVSHIVGQLIDITESKTNEILLHKYKEELEYSNQMAKIGSWEIDVKNNNEVIWNSALRNILELPQNYVPVFEKVLDFHPNIKHRETVINAMGQIINHGGNLDVTVQVKTYKNNIKWVRIIGISEFKDNQCQRLFGLFQDIDDIKKAQEEVALREEQFRQTFWHANAGMTMLDLKGKVTKANPYICKMFGFTEEEIINTPIPQLSHPDDREESQSLLKEILAGKRDNFQIEKRYFHKNGNVVWVSLSTSGVKNDNGELSHIICQLMDITENKLLTESLKEHNNRLVNFAHIVSHNLRSHTSNMTMLLDLNQTENPNVTENDFYNHLKSSSDNMSETVKYLSEIVQINTKVIDTMQPINIYNCVQRTLETIHASVEKQKCELKIDIDQYLEVMAVPAYLDSIVLNLLTNALKYSSPDRIPKIKIASGINNNNIFLRISDNGLGIDLNKHGSKLFGMYKTFHYHKDARGIGLFISKNQIEAMGGKIEVQSKVNEGTTFTIYFKHEQ